MQYDEFVGQVQHRARLGNQGDAVRAIRATLETLGDRIVSGQADNMAAQLPQEIGYYLQQTDKTERYSLDEFLTRVAEREKVDMPDATYHARVVISVLKDAISPSEVNNLQSQLPDEYRPLFSGYEGRMGSS